MLLCETDIEFDMLYMGPGKGCRKIIRCSQLGFSATIDCSNEAASKLRIIDDLEQCAYNRFVTGDFAFEAAKQSKAQYLYGLVDGALLDYTFSDDCFIRCFVRFELVRRGLFDADLYRLGLYGNSLAREQAIELLRSRAG